VLDLRLLRKLSCGNVGALGHSASLSCV